MGHAGAIISGGKGTAEDKFAALEAAGVKTVKSLAEIGQGLREVTGWYVDLISELNKIQSSYHFELVLTTPIRRFKDYQKGLFDSA